MNVVINTGQFGYMLVHTPTYKSNDTYIDSEECIKGQRFVTVEEILDHLHDGLGCQQIQGPEVHDYGSVQGRMMDYNAAQVGILQSPTCIHTEVGASTTITVSCNIAIPAVG